MHALKQAVARLVFGEAPLPQEFSLGMRGPQEEIAVWLCGRGSRREVTNEHSTACSDPFVLCLRLRNGEEAGATGWQLEYTERGGKGRVLGKIELRSAKGITPVGEELHFFEAGGSQNRCLPKLQIGAYHLLQWYRHLGRPETPGMKMTMLEQKAAVVSFIRPHPVGIASVEDAAGGNIFVMNLMGDLGEGRFGFGLKDSRWPAHLVERTGRLALSDVPAGEGRQAFALAGHHMVEHVDWERLPFGLRRSGTLGIRVPEFALRVRELEVESLRKMGSHTFFVARVVSDERWAEGEELHAVHGTYQAWRMRGRAEELRLSVVRDAENKRGLVRE